MNIAISTLLLGLGAAVIALVVHELGHLVAGLAVGFRFSFFAFGPLLVERTPLGPIRLGWNRVPSLAGGAAATLPTSVHSLRWRFAAVVAGGPCASALLAAGAAVAILLLPMPHGPLRVELAWLRLLSAAIFVGTAVPMPNGPFVTDGMRILRIIKRGPVGERELSLLTITALELAGVRPRDWDRSLCERGLAARDGSIFESQMHLYSYMLALDSGALCAAKQSLDDALAVSSRLAAFARAPCLVEAAYFEAAHRGDATQARKLLAQVKPGAFGVHASDYMRAQAAIAIAEGDAGSANESLSRALAASPLWAVGPRAWLLALQEIVVSVSQRPSNQPFHPTGAGRARR